MKKESITGFLSTVSHIGTHVDVVYGDKKIDLERFMGVGKLIDVSNIDEKTITMDVLQNKNKI